MYPLLLYSVFILLGFIPTSYAKISIRRRSGLSEPKKLAVIIVPTGKMLEKIE
jgi:hypothetical protein